MFDMAELKFARAGSLRVFRGGFGWAAGLLRALLYLTWFLFVKNQRI